MRHVGRLPPIAAPIAIAAIVVLILSVAVPALPTRQLGVRVHVATTAGAQIALYLNDMSDGPQVLGLAPGDRRTYEFDGPSGDLERIRVDILDANQARIRYYGIVVVDEDGKVLASFPPADLSGWAVYSAADGKLAEDAFELTATGPITTIDAFRTVHAPSTLPARMESIVNAVKQPERFLKFALLALGLGALVFGLLARRGRSALVVGAAAWATGILVLDLVLSNPAGVAEATDGVGRATFLGLSLPTNLRAVYALYTAAAAIALIGAALWWRLGRRQGPPIGRDGAVSTQGPPRGAAIALAGVVALAALAVFVPDLREIVRSATTGRYAAGWDSENMLAWSEFAARGLVPMDDFWYPYGNFSVFETGLLKGKIAFGLYQLALFAGFWWVFWIASARRLFASSLAALAVLAAEPIVGEFYRYGLALVIALAYTCIDVGLPRRTLRRARIVFGLVVTLGLFLDPILVAYAAAGVGPLVVVDIFRGRHLGLRSWFRRLALDFGLPFVGLVAAVTLAALQGQLEGLFELYTSLSENAVYSAEPTLLNVEPDTALEVTVVMVWLPALLFSVGLFGRLTTGSPTLSHGLSSRLLVTGGVAIPLLLKHAVRTTPTQLRLFVLIGLVLVILWAGAYRRAWPAVGALCGVGAALILAYPGPERIRDELRELPAVAASNVRLLILDRDELKRARNERFADERFAYYSHELLLARDIRSRPEVQDDTSLYVLGDAPIVYSLAHQRPPWQVTIYNSSLIEDQRRIVDWLSRERPPLVVVDRNAAEFDNVPSDVRVPLIFQHVIAHYEFDHAVGPYDVLLRRRGPVDVAYWNEVLGADSFLGRILDVSSYNDLDACSGRPDCRPFLRLTAPSESWTGRVNVPLRFGNHVVWVRFDAAGEQQQYTVSIERLWAWVLSESPRLAGPITPGWRAKIVRGIQRDDVLY